MAPATDRRRRAVPSVLAGLLLLAACGDGGAPGLVKGDATLDETAAPAAFAASTACDWIAARGSCMEATGTTATAAAQQDAACGATAGAVAAACPAAGLVGTCLIPSPVSVGLLRLYPPQTTRAGAAMCGNGAWLPAGTPAGTAAPAAVSCQDPFAGTCADTTGAMTPATLEAVRRFCTGNDGRLVDGYCPAAGRSGTCTTAPGELVWRTRHYRAAAAAADALGCQVLGGSWTDG